MPESMQGWKHMIKSYDNETVSLLIKKVNYMIISLSAVTLVLGLFDGPTQLLVFKPSSIWNLAQNPAIAEDTKTKAAATDATPGSPEENTSSSFSLPYFWTLATSNFIQPNPIYLVFYLLAINYIVQKNQRTLEQIWHTSDFLKLIIIAGIFSNMNLLILKVLGYEVWKNQDSYNNYSHCSLNLIVITLLITLRQQTIHGVKKFKESKSQ